MIARHLDCEYEWSIHAQLAREAGVADRVVDAIGEGREPQLEDSDQACLYRFVDSLLKRHDVADDTFNSFLDRFGQRGVVEMTALMGYYTLLAYLLNAVRFGADAPSLPKPLFEVAPGDP
jgi:4-carboxymuconolactone decarboxylase